MTDTHTNGGPRADGGAAPRAVAVDGVGMTAFRAAADESLGSLLATAAERALADGAVEPADVESVHVGNMAAEAFDRRSGFANAVAASLGVDAAIADRTENTSASGASAVHRAYDAVASGRSAAALVVGGERMSGTAGDATDVVGSVVHDRELAQGVTLPSFAGLAADAYLRRYDADRRALSAVAVKNHANATGNEYAQFRRTVDADEVESSPLVADPLRLYDCCPVGDGAAAVVLTAADSGNGGGDAEVTVDAVASGSGTHAVAERADPLRVRSVERAGTAAFERAGVGPADVDVACLHDAFTVLELLELEELGFYDRGTAWRATLDGETGLDGPIPVNPGGGLKARGHPLGATGVAQVVELVWQLRGDADGRQVRGPEVGLATNVAGFGNNTVCTVVSS